MNSCLLLYKCNLLLCLCPFPGIKHFVSWYLTKCFIVMKQISCYYLVSISRRLYIFSVMSQVFFIGFFPFFGLLRLKDHRLDRGADKLAHGSNITH